MDRVAALLATVSALRPVDRREETSRSAILAALEHGTQSFDDPQRHFTASAIVVSPERVLLHLHNA
jgi:hypothetical protein